MSLPRTPLNRNDYRAIASFEREFKARIEPWQKLALWVGERSMPQITYFSDLSYPVVQHEEWVLGMWQLCEREMKKIADEMQARCG